MKPLLKVLLALFLVFASIFILGRVLGILTIENVKHWLDLAHKVDVKWLVLCIIALLTIDIFVTVPTLAVSVLAGFFLGFPLGALIAFIGMCLSSLTGYTISRKWGERGIGLLIKTEDELEALKGTFGKHGAMMIVLSRAVPMLPEVTACLAGATKMSAARFSLCLIISTGPYALIAAYAGSVSSIDNPKPAIYAALALYAVLWVGGFAYKRFWQKS